MRSRQLQRLVAAARRNQQDRILTAPARCTPQLVSQVLRQERDLLLHFHLRAEAEKPFGQPPRRGFLMADDSSVHILADHVLTVPGSRRQEDAALRNNRSGPCTPKRYSDSL